MDEITDLTLPDESRIDRRAGAAIEAFKQVVFPDGYDPEARGTKRKVNK